MKTAYILQYKKFDKYGDEFEWENITIFADLDEFDSYWKWLEKQGHAPFNRQRNLRLIEKQ